MTRLTDDELTELELMEKTATPGPWEYSDDGFTDDVRAGYECLASLRGHHNGDNTAENAKLVAAVRNALPSLLAELRELRAAAREVVRLSDEDAHRFFMNEAVDVLRNALRGGK
jgi:hypothetical protein